MEVNIPKSEIKVMPKPWRINANTILSYSGLTRELTVSHICQDLIVISGNSSSLHCIRACEAFYLFLWKLMRNIRFECLLNYFFLILGIIFTKIGQLRLTVKTF